jgi:hypothetical protein
VLHIFIGSLKRQWWVIFTLAFGGASESRWILPRPRAVADPALVEAIGWGGRIMSVTGYKWNENFGGLWEYDHNSFIIQYAASMGLVMWAPLTRL